MHAFPKIFTLGQDYIKDIFLEDVEITEKVDGSQFCMGVINGELNVRSKGSQLYVDNPDKMFKLAVDYALSISKSMPEGLVFYCEYLMKPKHNVLKYDRVPKNNIILFGVSDLSGKFYPDLEHYAQLLGIESVPVLYKGKVTSIEDLKKYLETDSILGGTKIEGFVVKNYSRPFLLGGQPIPLMSGKFVSEAFKEIHGKEWKRDKTGKGKWETYCETFRTDARWLKSIQHLKEKGELENSPRDIGKLLKEIKEDIAAEEKENIMKFLWREFGDELLRKSTAGFPEWYKEHLLKNLNFDDGRKE